MAIKVLRAKMRYDFIYTRLAKQKKTNNAKCQRGCGAEELAEPMGRR